MPQDFEPGDFLIFQLESGFGLLRVLETELIDTETIWHVAAYRDLFPDIESAETASLNVQGLTVELPHVALTNRAFESTQMARLGHLPLEKQQHDDIRAWQVSPDRQIHDRSIRLLLGLR
jgi:hypothetical protein